MWEPRNSPLRKSETRPGVSRWLHTTTFAWNGSPYFTSCRRTHPPAPAPLRDGRRGGVRWGRGRVEGGARPEGLVHHGPGAEGDHAVAVARLHVADGLGDEPV